MIFKKLVPFCFGIIGALVLLVGSRFIPVGHDYTQAATVGVITKYGLPLPFAFWSSGYSRIQFDFAAATWNFVIYFILTTGLIIYIKSKNKTSV